MNKDKNPIPFYELEGDVWTNTKPLWQHNSPNCKGYCYSHNLFPDTYFFQHKVSASILATSDIVSVELRRVSDNTVVAQVFEKYLYKDENDEKYLIIKSVFGSALIGDRYYIATTTAYNKYYSEVFCVTNIKYDSIGLVWASDGKVGNMIYQNDFVHKINIEAKLLMAPPEIEEETEEDGFGNETPTLQKLVQSYTFSCVIPNFLAQALSAMPLHNQFKFIDYLNEESGTDTFDEGVTKVSTVVTPEEDGCFSFVEVTFVKETIIKTACNQDLLGIADVIPLNNPPQADIVWNDTQTTEIRDCSTDETCEQTLLITDLTFDVDGNLDTLEWERSTDLGATWVSAGVSMAETKTFTETSSGQYWYRLKVTDTEGLFAYSNVLKYLLYNVVEQAILTNVTTLADGCPNGGSSANFDIEGNPDQSVKMQLKVLMNYGNGFFISIRDRNTNAEVAYFESRPVGGIDDAVLLLDDEGKGFYRVDVCLNPCLSTTYQQYGVSFTLYENDGIELSSQSFARTGYKSCV